MNNPNLYQKKIAVPLFLFLLSMLSYAILSPWLGFLQDDWYIMWHAHAFGPAIFVHFFSWERPGLAGIYWLTTSILGTSPLVWQLFVVICRWLVTVVFWWMLNLVWPRNPRQVTWIALLFAVYPGFRSIHFSVMFANLLLILAIHIFSFCAMILAIKRPGWFIPLTLLSVLCAAFSLFSAEYFFGWELLRPIFIWIALNRKDQQRRCSKVTSILRHWIPYLAVVTAFFVWRVFIFKFPTKYQPVLFSETFANPPATVFKIIAMIVQDLFDTSLFAWQRTTSLLKVSEISELSLFLALGLAIIAGVVTAVWLSKREGKVADQAANAATEIHDNWAKSALWVGLSSAVLAGWPFWSVGLEVNSDIGPDRFTLAFMMGACILIVGLLDTLMRTHTQEIILLSILIGLATGQHFVDANVLRRVHESQASFFRQLTWRIPALAPGSILVTDKFPLPYSSDTSLSAPLNWIYDQRRPHSMQYAILELESRLGNVIPELKAEVPILFGYRATKLYSSTSDMVVFNYSPPGCVHIVDPAVDLSITLPELVASAASLSNLDRILVDTRTPVEIPNALFGPEPESQEDWCYYYEKADLARQRGDWESVVALGETAFEQGLQPETPIELLPFIEGYFHKSLFFYARQLTVDAWRKEPALQPVLCAAWERSVRGITLKDRDTVYVTKTNAQLGCPDN